MKIMKLELNIHEVKDIRFGGTTAIRERVLSIDRKALQNLLEADKRLGRVDVELAHPGERCRILQVCDVIEPRVKISASGEDVSDPVSPGSGRTSVLRNTAVVLSDYRKQGDVTTSKDPNGEIIDMFGPGADIGTFGKTHNVVVLPRGKEGIGNPEYLAALKIAGMKAAAFLAGAGGDMSPDKVEVYDLPPLSEVRKGLENLPRVTYVFQILSLQFQAIPGDPVLYGGNAEGMMPTLLHPNEILDGAVTSALPALNVQTYHIQNHPIIEELYHRHGKDLCFTGVIVTTAPNNVFEYERVANMVANLAARVIGADGAVLTKTGGGAPELVMARTAQRCEQLGVKTAIAMLHMGADIRDAKYGASTIFSIPEADAIVSMGYPFMELTLPPVERVIGRPSPVNDGPAVDGELVRAIRWIKGSQCQLGSSKLTAVRY
jgi:glycine reductase